MNTPRMKIGILLCDHVNPLLQPKHGDYPQMFETLFDSISKSFELHHYDVVNGELPLSIHECDSYVISGSKHSVNDPFPWIHELRSFLTELYEKNKKVIGICFGHQLIATTFGGKVALSDKGWGIGVSSASIQSHQPWMNTKQNQLNLLVSHQEQVMKIPQGAQILLSNEFCPISMYQMGEHFLGLQGHPEFSKPYATDLMNLRKDNMRQEQFTKGIESLKLQVDEKIVTNWLRSFLTR